MEQGAVRCAVYTRQSVARKDSSDFSSCEAQRESCLSFIASHAREGWFPAPERFDDEGYSGATAERPAFARLLRAVAAKKVDRVVVQRIDRITRSIADWGRLVVTLRRHGAGFSVVSGELHLGDVATSDLVLNLLATFAQFEREIIGERLRDARVALRRRGIRNAGRVPFAYTADPLTHQLLVQPEAEQIVKRIFEMAAADAPPSAIALWINTLGDRDRRVLDGRQPWTAKTVLRVLTNRTYLGRMGDVEGAHDAIVTAELFSKARTAIESRRTRSPTKRSSRGADPFILRGLLHCAQCGRRMTTSSSRRLVAPAPRRRGPKPKQPPRYYRCRGRTACSGSQVSAQYIEDRVIEWLTAERSGLSFKAAAVLGAYAPHWRKASTASQGRLLSQLVWEIRWDVPRRRLSVTLDEVAIAEEHARLEGPDRPDERPLTGATTICIIIQRVVTRRHATLAAQGPGADPRARRCRRGRR